ncbi:isochorismatase [Sphingomonas glacialis]|uniref:Isochorismatase n=1 Tax=Sphingomonas glacialis TaxID=658225 RepID=A0ABQ3LU91_9SPHN|nr:isochorismatase family protein [Sphingomonas glacialis]GHH26024.1 isochorismatase [Sphingomonas glacialis]
MAIDMSKQALLVVDRQQGPFTGPRHDAAGLLARPNDLAVRLRAKGTPIIFIQHCGPEGDDLHPSKPGHALHEDLAVEALDTMITKASCDAFLETILADTLAKLEIDELIVTGCATDFCVDTTIRSALARGYKTIVPEDGHTTGDRPYLSAEKIIEHHNAVWANFISPVGPAHLTHCERII